MKLDWTQRSPGVWTASAGPLAIKIRPQGDGRWAWEVLQDGASGPMGTGIVSSLGAAKSVTQQLVMRSGLV